MIPVGQVKFAPPVVVLSSMKNSERYLAEFRNLSPGQFFRFFHPKPKAEPPPTLVIFLATLEVITPTVTEGSL